MTRDEVARRERRLIAEAFKRAKELVIAELGFIKPGQTRYICYALSYSTPKNASREVCDAHNAAESIVGKRIFPSAYLDDWVIDNVPGTIHFAEDRYAEFQREMQAFRHRWLDALIKEFSNAG